MDVSNKDNAETLITLVAAGAVPAAGPLHLLVLYTQEGQARSAQLPLPETGALTVGRSSSCDLLIDDPSISRSHARLTLTTDGLTLTDLGSANGTRVRGQLLRPGEPAFLRPGESFELARAVVLCSRSPTAQPTAPAPPASACMVASQGMQPLQQLVERVAHSPISVLILGETGVGKEVMAETLHRLSPRAQSPLLRLHCAALNESLLESELFGHERGAFTGAAQAKRGLLETADGGTVFLDEVGELPPSIQVKLLRFLEDRKVQRVGGLQGRELDVRILSATNRNLHQEIERGAFRQDLYFRLNGISLWIPPLRQRLDELTELARQHLLAAATRARRPTAPRLSQPALLRLRTHAWPGNIRELRSVMERALICCGGDEVGPEHLLFEDLGSAAPRAAAANPKPGPAQAPAPPAFSGALRQQQAALERQAILDALEQTAGNQSRAAQLLGMPRRTLLSRLDEYGISRPRKR